MHHLNQLALLSFLYVWLRGLVADDRWPTLKTNPASLDREKKKECESGAATG